MSVDYAESPPLDNLDVDGSDRPLNPVEIEAGLRKIARMNFLGIRIVSKAEEDSRKAAAAYDRALAHAYINHDGPAHEKKYAAEIHPSVVAARDARDVAELAFRHAERRQRELGKQLDALRSINTSVREMYRSETGYGR